jgi:hypothetical protein
MTMGAGRPASLENDPDLEGLLLDTWRQGSPSIGYKAIERAAEKIGDGARDARARGSLFSWGAWRHSIEFKTFQPEGTNIRFVVVTSIAGDRSTVLANFVSAMCAIGANPGELLTGGRKHGPLSDGRYFAIASILPGSRVPMPEHDDAA